ncbi:MAG: murein biosynthesis integral membrane protein MurJ [bacterium]|nr:MAG: murein biosynthesis integral membrane protein MurJ [bacterium]
MQPEKGRSDRGKMVRAAGVVGGATAVSRVLGLLRDAVMASLFGASPATDAFFVAFRLPNLMRQLFGEGALASSFVPVYTDIREKQGEEQARLFSSNLISLLFIILTAITLVGVLLAPALVRVIALGFKPGSDVFRLTVLLTRWMLPYMVLICTAALFMGILNSHRHFLAPAAAPALLNICIIAAAFVVSPGLSTPILALAWAVLAGGLLQFLTQIPPMWSRGILPAPRVPVLTPEVRRMALMMGPAVLGVAVYQVNILVDTLLASFLPTGSITYLWYGNRIMQFPLGVFGIALATAALPTLSKQISEGRREDFRGTVSFSLALTAFIGLPATLGLIALREPIMLTLFGRGAFSNADVRGAATALLFYAAGLLFFIAVKILGRAFFAVEDTRTPFKAAGTAFLVNTLLNLALMGPMGYAGLALATSLASGVNFMILARHFSRKLAMPWADAHLVRETVRSFSAAAVMLGALVLVAARVDWLVLPALARALWLLGCVVLGIGVYSIAALIFGCKSMKTLKNRLFEGPGA